MTPDFQLVANSNSVSNVFRDRLLSIRVTDESDIKSDTIEIKLDDRGLFLEWPEFGDQIECYLGYKNEELARVGIFIVDEVSHSGPPYTLSIRANATDMRAEFKQQKFRSWDNVTIETIVRVIAGEQGLIPKVSMAMASIFVLHEDQTDESDFHFLSRLAKEYDGVVKPSNGYLLFLNKGESKSVSGRIIDTVDIDVSQIIGYRMTHAERGKFLSVRAYQQDTSEAEMVEVMVGEGTPTYTISGPSPTLAEASDRARAKLKSLTRGTAALSFSVHGNTDLRADGKVNVTGIRSLVDGEWSITSVSHSLDSSGFITSVEAEVPSAT